MAVHPVSLKNKLNFRSLNKETWSDFEELLGERGGCWCMSWRLPRSEFSEQKGSGNKAAMKELAEGGKRIGVLAYFNWLVCRSTS